MSRTVQLPSTLQGRIASVARRVRLLRTVRGVSLLVLALSLIAGAALLADFLLDGALPAAVRGVNLALWLGIAGLLTLAGLVLPLLRPLAAADLAAVIEEKYPQLGERLTTSIELCENSGAGNGSPALIALLVRETEARTNPLDFGSAISARSTRTLAVLAGVMALATLLPAALYPTDYGLFARRFFVPWNTRGALPDFFFHVEPGDAVAARGRVLPLAVELTPRKSRIALPRTATLVVIGEDGAETTHEMAGDATKQSRYTIGLRVKGDFHYRMSAGNTSSSTFDVKAVTPVDLATESPKITVTPPDYASSTIDADTLTGLVDVTALRHSQITFDFHFSRPAVSAVLEILAGDSKDAAVKTHKLPLSEDGTTASLILSAQTSGSYRVRMEAEHGITTERDGGTITVKEDLPPAMIKFFGKETLLSVRRFDKVPLEARLSDDIGVASADLVYRINEEQKTHEERFALDGANTRDAIAKHQFLLSGKVKEGDEVYYRIRYRDNLPEKFGGPHTLYYPADRWLRLKIVKDAGSVREQEIISRRDEIARKLAAIRDDLKQEKRAADKVRAESRGQESLSADQSEQLRNVTKQNQGIEKALRDLAEDLVDSPELDALAEKARDIAGKEMRQSESALRDAASPQAKADKREQRLRTADRELDNALRKLDDLKEANEKTAQERLDQAKVEALADRQKDLADRAAELANKHPVVDPEAKKLAEQIKREQHETADELKKLTDKSETLKKALEEARAEQARQAADKARELAQSQRDLAKASEEMERKRDVERLAELARKQKELADKADHLAKETEQPARATRTPPLKPEATAQAAESLKQGEADKALNEQDRSARELDRMANDLDRSINLAKDPREAAQQLARLEEDLAKRTKDSSRGRQATPDRMKDLHKEQQAIRAAAEELSIPPANKEAQNDKQNAIKQMDAAADALAKNRPSSEAQAKMEQAKQTLQRLAGRLPSLDQRRNEALQKVQQLKRDQEEVARKIAEAARNPKEAPQKLADAARKQAENAEALAKLDAPNQEARRDRAEDAAAKALKDILDGRKADQPASQAVAKRELDRLEQALSGRKPADEKAAELAARQKAVAQKAEKMASDPATPKGKQEELNAQQRQIAAETAQLEAKEAASTKAQAAEATKKAAGQAAMKGLTNKDTQAAMQEAAKKLDELARALRGEESDADKATRLARKQKKEAADSEQAAAKQPNVPPSAQARQRQKDIADEAKYLRGRDEGQAEKKKADDALARAESATKPADRAKAQREAAEALQNLADKLSARKDDAQIAKRGEPSARQKAQELANQQRRLAEQTRQAQQAAARKPGEAGKKDLEQALQKMSAQQNKLNEQASKLPANESPRELAQARSAMNQAKDALERKDAGQASQKQQEAAQALSRLAQRSPATRQPSPTRTARNDPSKGPAQPRNSALPSKAQADQARELAKEQRELRDAVRKANEQLQADRRAEAAAAKDNPAGKLAAEQEAIARDAAKLAKDVANEQGEKSGSSQKASESTQSAQQAAKALQSGSLSKAQESGKQAAQQMQQLARQLSQTPRGSDKGNTPDTLQQVRGLAQRQEALNKQMAPLANNPTAQRALQQARQADLARQTGELMSDLEKMAQTPGKSPQAQASARSASSQAQQAQQQMRQAQQQTQQGNQPGTQQSRNQAAQALDRAAAQAKAASDQSAQASGQKPGQPSNKTGESVQQAQGQMNQAQGQLQQGKPNSAQSSMKQAAQSLAKAAQQMAQAMQRSQPTGPTNPREGAAGGGVVDSKLLPKELARYSGKRWGELPGEVRSKIVQEMKAKYGDDYARMIKLYFEQIADTRRGAKK